MPTSRQNRRPRLTACMLALLVCCLAGHRVAAMVEPASPDAPADPAGPAATVLIDPGAADRFDINGEAYALYDVLSGDFLFGRAVDEPLPPASITKVMTVLLALENLGLSDTITVTRAMFETIPNDYVRLGLVEGEQISVEETLYACLLISANDAAMALALTLSPTVEDFAARMNARALELGCTGTHFTNPYGLAEEDNLTTAHDMALILAAVLEHDVFSQIARTESHLIPPTNKADSRGMTNGNRFICTDLYAYPDYIGGKTGFTNLSGHTIVAGARRDGRTLVGVILGATASETRYVNLAALFDYGFTGYGEIAIDTADFSGVCEQKADELQATVASESLGYLLESTSIKLDGYASATLAQMAGGISCVAGDAMTPLEPGLPGLEVAYPLCVEFEDGTRNIVGSFQASLRRTAARAAIEAVEAAAPKTPASSAVALRTVGILLAGLSLCALAARLLLPRRTVRVRRHGGGARSRPQPRKMPRRH